MSLTSNAVDSHTRRHNAFVDGKWSESSPEIKVIVRQLPILNDEECVLLPFTWRGCHKMRVIINIVIRMTISFLFVRKAEVEDIWTFFHVEGLTCRAFRGRGCNGRILILLFYFQTFWALIIITAIIAHLKCNQDIQGKKKRHDGKRVSIFSRKCLEETLPHASKLNSRVAVTTLFRRLFLPTPLWLFTHTVLLELLETALFLLCQPTWSVNSRQTSH